jgi:tRNA 2-thiouridine synthesizing protein A
MRRMIEAVDQELDLSGMSCPMPLLKTKQALNRLAAGKILKVVATDPASERDFKVFSEQSGIPLLDSARDGNKYIYWLRKP